MSKPIKEIVREEMKLRGINILGLAEQTGIPSGRIYKWYDEKKPANPKEADADKLKEWLSSSKTNLEEVRNEAGRLKDFDLSGVDQTKPIIQVVLNLSYIGKKNADSMDKMADSVKEMTTSVNKMAATNQRNTEIIAALVSTMLPNSKLAEKLAASLAGSPADDDEVPPIEGMLNKAGIDFLKQQMQAGKKTVKNK